MKNKYLKQFRWIIIILVGLTTKIDCQDYAFDWVNLWGGNFIVTSEMAVDLDNNLYTAGRFQGNSTDFDPGPDEYIVNTSQIFKQHISKFNTFGELQWVQVLESNYTNTYTAYDGVEIKDIETSANGDVYVAGYFIDTMTYTTASGVESVTATADIDGFFAKYNSDGELQWMRTYGDAYDTQATAIAITDAGDIYLTGYFAENVQFNPNGTTEYAEYYDMFVMKLNANDEFQWVYTTQFTNHTLLIEPYEIVADDNHGVVVTGFYWEFDDNDLDFDSSSGTTLLPGTGGYNNFLVKLDTAGNFDWANSYNTAYTDIGHDLHISTTGEILMAARMGIGTLDPDPTSSGEEITATNGGANYLLKVDTNGDFIWIKKFEPTHYTAGSHINYQLEVDKDDNIFLQGTFEGSLDIDPGPESYIIQKVTGFTNDAYMVKLNADGEFIAGQGLGTTSSDIGKGLISDSFGNVYGSFTGAGDESIMLGDIAINGSTDFATYFYKITACDSEMVHQIDDSTLYADATNATYQWLDCDNGNSPIPGETNRTFVPSVSGNYALQATNYNCTDTSACFNINLEALSIKDDNFEAYKVYPNPTSGIINVQGVKEVKKVEVFNLRGQIISSFNSNNIKMIDISALDAGIYMLKIETQNVSKHIKIIKQ